MKCKIDLTKEKFDRIDFSQARIVDFFCRKELPRDFKFTIWGATIWLEPRWDSFRPRPTETELTFKKPHNVDMYVSGIGTFAITQLAAGYIKVSPYSNIPDSRGATVIARERDDSIISYTRAWNMSDAGKYDEYLWELSMAWPPTACVLYLYSDNGTADFEFDDADMIDADAFIRDPQKYTYHEKEVRGEMPVPRALQLFEKRQSDPCPTSSSRVQGNLGVKL